METHPTRRKLLVWSPVYRMGILVARPQWADAADMVKAASGLLDRTGLQDSAPASSILIAVDIALAYSFGEDLVTLPTELPLVQLSFVVCPIATPLVLNPLENVVVVPVLLLLMINIIILLLLFSSWFPALIIDK